MRIALVHDYLTYFGGAERTFKALTELFPQAEVYALFYNPKIKKKFFPNTEIKTSFLQKLPFVLKKKYQILLPLLPIAIETLDFRDFDVVISSSHSFAKGIITRPKTVHICYCYSPTRYLWDSSRGHFLLHYFRIWDRQASERVDYFVACSKTVQQRIKKYYKRESVVIYPPATRASSLAMRAGPPVEMIDRLGVTKPVSLKGYVKRQTFNDTGSENNKRKTGNEFYLIVSQLRKYKRIDIAVEAFNKLGLELVIIGDGPERKKLQKMAKKNIKFLGWQPDKIVGEYYKGCTAFIFPSEDDFGIAPIEAMSYGKPVLAYRKGGATETIIEGKTGEFFDWQDPAALADGIRRIRQNLSKYDPEFIYNHTKKFSQEQFEKNFKQFIKETMSN